MKKSTIILLLTLSVLTINAQEYHKKFQEYFRNNNESKLSELFEQWEQEFPKDPELFTSLFNYYFYKSKDEIVMINGGQPPQGKQVLLLKDSTDNVAGFIGSQINYEESTLKKAFESINRGIELYPNRLDMRFGKIFVLGQIKDWNSFTKEIIKNIHYSAENNNKWTWTYNEEKTDGQNFFLTGLQDYQMQLYNTMNDKLLVNMQEISKAVLKHYPKHVESLSNMSIGYLVTKQYDKALEPLLKAEKINPSDYIVLSNIAYAYKEKGDKEKAITYYTKVIELGDEQMKMQAEQELNKLKAN